MLNNEIVSVVIPFYQTSEGILSQAVRSALKQKNMAGKVKILVIDDASPVKARNDLRQLVCEFPGKIRIIEQENQGPGLARNKGLANIFEGTKFVAFLDSDDCWEEGHLENAVYALNQGFDFYFSDFIFSDFKKTSAFNRAQRIVISEHKNLDNFRSIFEYSGNMFDQILVKGNIVGTSTVVCRYEKISDLRFRKGFFNAGEDYLFWLDCWDKGVRKIVFSTQVEVKYGSGVNIFSASKWGTENLINRLYDELKTWKAVEKFYELTSLQKQENKKRLQGIVESICLDILHRISSRKKIKFLVLLEIFKLEPMVILILPVHLLRAIRKKTGK